MIQTPTNQISQEIAQLNTLQSLVNAYEEIASVRMKKTREAVLKNRRFLIEINSIFEEVRLSYASKIKELSKKRIHKNSEKITFLAHNGKKVAVFIAAQTGLYGEIITKTFSQFINEIKSENSEATIIGKHGLALFTSELPNHPYTFFDLSDTKIKEYQLTQIIKHIVQYEEIHVYHGEYISVVTQKPKKLTISAEISLKDNPSVPKISYVFEPSLENILKFFETEIFASVFYHAIREAQLSKFASRVLAMDKADDNIQKNLKQLNFNKQRISHQSSNRKQLNALPGTFKAIGRFT